MNADSLTLIPRISEKALQDSEAPQGQVVVFEVPITANRAQIADAITAQFGVEVARIKTLRVKGKVVRTARKRARPISGTRKTIKKAYVTVGKDSRIAILDEPKEKK